MSASIALTSWSDHDWAASMLAEDAEQAELAGNTDKAKALCSEAAKEEGQAFLALVPLKDQKQTLVHLTILKMARLHLQAGELRDVELIVCNTLQAGDLSLAVRQELKEIMRDVWDAEDRWLDSRQVEVDLLGMPICRVALQQVA